MDHARKWRQVKRLSLLLVIAYAAVFLLRWGYEMVFAGNDITISYSAGEISSNFGDKGSQSNIATGQVRQMDSAGQVVMLDQKYEKTANLSSTAGDFSAANDQLRAFIGEQEAVIQLENLSGLEGARRLDMAIGVIPDRFDALVEQIRQVGELQSFSVNKVDRTSEYRNLMAEVETLTKTRESYEELKQRGGNIQDSLLLEEKILEVERSLQSIGVDMGLFSTENSFCTVNFTLIESSAHSLSVRFALSRAKDSALWTLGLFALVLVVAVMALGAVYCIVSLSWRVRSGPQQTPGGPAPNGAVLPENDTDQNTKEKKHE